MALYFECYLETKKKREEKEQEERLLLCFDFGLSDKSQKTRFQNRQRRKTRMSLIDGGVFKNPGITCRMSTRPPSRPTCCTPRRRKTRFHNKSTDQNVHRRLRRGGKQTHRLSNGGVVCLGSPWKCSPFHFFAVRPVFFAIFSCFPRDLEHFCPFTQEIGGFYRRVG